uniref:C-type lectin n=1 Tax=Pristionchus pacificus TaxID=54126 RepID=A0A2A6C7S7_PRIPA|eukprot:PDM74262.1 C-type lectin [Pristionchus pacificus]
MVYTLKYYLTVVTVVLGGSAQFYSYGVVNPAQRLIMDWINQTYYDRNGDALGVTELNLFWSFVVSSIAVGAIVGALLTRVISERCGRRNGLILNGAVNVVGAVLELLAKPTRSPELLLVGRFVLGVNMGLTSGLVPMYLMEITPASSRGVAGTLHQVAVAFSDWFSLLIGLPEVLGSAVLWPFAFAFPGLFALLLVLVLPFSPESPKYLMSTKKDRMGALDACRSLVGHDAAQHMYEELVKEHIQEQDQSSATFRELFTSPQLRVPLAAAGIVMLAQQFTGCTAVFAYSTDMFVNAKLDQCVSCRLFHRVCSFCSFRKYRNTYTTNLRVTARFATLAIGIAYFVFTCSAPLLIERVGRRPLLLFQLSACFVSLLALTIFTGLQTYSKVSWASYGMIGALVVYMCVYGVGSPIPWMITGELFNQRFRSCAVTVSVFIAWFLAFLTSTAYLPFSQLVGVTFSYLPFLVGLLVSTTVMFFLLPETRHRAPSEILEEVRERSSSLASGRPWEAVTHTRPTSRQEMQSAHVNISKFNVLGNAMRFAYLLLLLLCAGGVRTYTFTCEEMLYHFNRGTIDDEITHACVILPDGNRNVEQLKKFHLTPHMTFADIFNAPGHCVKRANGVAWQPRVDDGAVCTPEFILIEAKQQPAIITPGAEPDQHVLDGQSVVLVVPQTGMWIGKSRCVGQGNVTFSTGADIEEPGLDMQYRSWPCHSIPVRIDVFDSVVTVKVDANVQFTMQTSSYIGSYNSARSGNHFAVFSSGRSNDRQNMEGYYNHANFKMDKEDEVTVNMDLTFDSANTGSVILKKSAGGVLENFYNGQYSENFNTKYFEIQWTPKPLKPNEIYYNQDKIVVDIFIGPQATAPPPVASKNEYCNCAVDKFGLPDGWKYNDIWLDVVIVLDTSEAMGERSLVDASALIESLISDGVDDLLITDPAGAFYTRIGVIAVADTAEILYNLNMTKTDKVTASVKQGVKEMDFNAAYSSALSMFSDGLTSQPNRAGTRQVVYFLTNSDPDCKRFAKPIASATCTMTPIQAPIPRFRLREVAIVPRPRAFPSPKLRVPVQLTEESLQPFMMMRRECFCTMMTKSASKSDYYWIGYEKSNQGEWEWEDQSTNPYTNWGPHEPSLASVAKCAYVDATTKNLTWGAGNCQIGFPYVCEFVPCSVGRKNCRANSGFRPIELGAYAFAVLDCSRYLAVLSLLEFASDRGEKKGKCPYYFEL